MRLSFAVLYLLSIFALCSAAGLIPSWKSGDRLLFPEQVDYLQKQLKFCANENLILWGDGRCYKEFEVGPCYAGRVITLDRKLLKPYCKEV